MAANEWMNEWNGSDWKVWLPLCTLVCAANNYNHQMMITPGINANVQVHVSVYALGSGF